MRRSGVESGRIRVMLVAVGVHDGQKLGCEARAAHEEAVHVRGSLSV